MHNLYTNRESGTRGAGVLGEEQHQVIIQGFQHRFSSLIRLSRYIKIKYFMKIINTKSQFTEYNILIYILQIFKLIRKWYPLKLGLKLSHRKEVTFYINCFFPKYLKE